MYVLVFVIFRGLSFGVYYFENPIASYLIHEQDSSSSEVDCPPGFEQPRIAIGIQSLAPSVSSSFEMKNSSEGNLLSSDTPYDDMEFVLEYVLNDLHSSAKLSLVHYLEILVNEEVKKVVDLPQSSHMEEVVERSIHHKPYLSPFHSGFP